MNLLIDTNIVLEILLGQARSKEARELLAAVDQHAMHLTDFTLHSIGLVLFRREQQACFSSFVQDVILSGGCRLVSLAPNDLTAVVDAASRFGLDFDDAYQYAVAEKYGLTIISFDADFDRTERGRKEPKNAS